MATEIAKAYVQIIPSAKGIKGELTDIMDPEAKKAGTSSGKALASNIGSALGKGAAMIGAGMAAAVGGIATLSKSALDAYADYEQLTGGVETLFGDSADIIMKYADDAYKTAGLSANEYMETVTSFSASLLQSLGGDTEQAANYAQMAITDMSDNANKMGTSMESIQAAYSGFSKQNFTMLDNLKLGYGGTKTEMERLLADATALSGVEYDVSSYADIVAAIHVVQDNLGITGTTAKEASTTISGSVASMKSAWANFMTSMNGTPDQIGKATDALIGSVTTAANNIVPKLTSIIPNVVNGIASIAQALIPQIPPIVESLLPALVTGASTLVQELVNVLPDLLAGLSAVIPDLINAIMTAMPMLLEAAIQIIMALAEALVGAAPMLIPAAVDMILDLVDGFLDNLDDMISLGIDLVMAIGAGLIDAIPRLIERIPEIIDSLVKALLDPDTIIKLVMSADALIRGLATGLIKAIPALIAAVPEIIKSLIDVIKSWAVKFKDIGPDLVAGLWQGIKDSWSSLVSNVKNLGSDLLSGIKGIFGIHSPSTAFEYIGDMCTAGLNEGLAGMEDTVDSTKKMLSDEMRGNFGLDTQMNVTQSLSANRAMAPATSQIENNGQQIAAAVYDALSNLALNASINLSPNMRKFFEEMQIQAQLQRRRTGQEALV